jgi:hypothetical protein
MVICGGHPWAKTKKPRANWREALSTFLRLFSALFNVGQFALNHHDIGYKNEARQYTATRARVK